MRLTRRDALAALGAAGLAGSTAGCTSLREDSDTEAPTADAAEDAPAFQNANSTAEALRAVAAVLYPSDVEVTDEFVDTYVRGRATVDDAYLAAVADAYAFVDDAALERRDAAFRDLSATARDDLLRELDLHAVDPAADGEGAAHARFYLIDELLFALYSTPLGTERAGIRSPRGHPGGVDTYDEAPEGSQ